MDGEFTAKIAVGSDDKNYPDVVISGVKTTISVPTFTLKTDNLKFDSKQGSINSDKAFNGSTTVAKGDKIVLTPAPEEGYEFDKFEIVAGLEAAGQDGNSYSFKVEGDKDPEIKAIFKAKGATVTYNTPDAAQGTLRVTKAENNELVPSGNTVPVGTKLLITAKAKDGYNVGDVTFTWADKSTEIPSIKGTVTEIESNYIVLDNNGIQGDINNAQDDLISNQERYEQILNELGESSISIAQGEGMITGGSSTTVNLEPTTEVYKPTAPSGFFDRLCNFFAKLFGR